MGTYGSVAFLKDLVGQKLQGATVYSRLSSQVALDSVIGFPTVSRTSMENNLPLDGTSLRVPNEKTSVHTHKPKRNHNVILYL